jgi:hypothetical protein
LVRTTLAKFQPARRLGVTVITAGAYGMAPPPGIPSMPRPADQRTVTHVASLLVQNPMFTIFKIL